MPLLDLSSFSLSIAATTLLDSVDAILVEGEKVGLVGRNGCGKSTLLKVLAQSDDCPSDDSYFAITSGKLGGEISLENRVPGSVLLVGQQELSWSSLFRNLGEEHELRAMPLPEVLDLAIAYGLEGAVEDEESWRRLSAAANEDLHWNVARYDITPLGQLSPGSALRAYLAIALHRADVQLLLLDEPTNHLDLPAILWLQNTIQTSGQTVITVSHDEAFLDAVTDYIWEIDDIERTLRVSGVKYSHYKHAKLLGIEQRKQAYLEQEKRHKRLTKAATDLRMRSKRGERFQGKDHDKLLRDFKRDRSGRSGKKASGLDKHRDAHIVSVDPVIEAKSLNFKLEPFQVGESNSSIVLISVKLGYTIENEKGQKTEFPLRPPPLSLRISYGERVGIIGYNAIGKSTLLKTLMGEIEPLRGTVSVGRELRIGNLVQEQTSLPRDKTPRIYASEVFGEGMSLFDVGNSLIAYGLTLHQVDHVIGELNPGAVVRLMLASFAMRHVNALVLDEPTNHLDEEAVAEVTRTLNAYPGIVLAVSHDRGFLNAIKLSRTCLLSPAGLRNVESVNTLVEQLNDAVKKVVKVSFR